MAEESIVIAAKAVYRAVMGSGLPTVGSSMSWGLGIAEVQTLDTAGTPTGGTFKLTYRGVPGTVVAEETSALTFDEAAADVDAALEALTSIGAADVVCAGGALPTDITITFATLLADKSILPIKPTTVALTGGADSAVTIVRTTPGSAGWTEIEDVTDAGIEIVMEYSGKDVRQLGRIEPHEEKLLTYGAKSIKFQTYDSTEATLALALPDSDTSGAYMTGGAARSYIAIAVHTDNCVWYFPRVSAVGNATLTYDNENFTEAPFEFKVFENPYAAIGTPNWQRHPIT